MQSTTIDIIQRLRVLNLYKNLHKQLMVVNKLLSNNQIQSNNKLHKSLEQFNETLRNEFRQNSVSDSRYCMQKNEMLFLANAYSTYLNSTRRTLELYDRYCRGERSIEESARLVGLRLPKQYEDPNGTAHK
jgi:hypothetical protein